MRDKSKGRARPRAGKASGSPRASLNWPLTFVIPAKSLPRTRYGAGIQTWRRQLRIFVIPAKAGIQSGLRRILKLLVDPVGPGRAGAMPSEPRAHIPVRGAWESACGWEARWNVWLASPSSPMWRGDGEQPRRP